MEIICKCCGKLIGYICEMGLIRSVCKHCVWGPPSDHAHPHLPGEEAVQ